MLEPGPSPWKGWLGSIWAGMWFAERLSTPVGRLTGAAQRVGSGDLDVRVPEEEGDDEIAMLGRYFNQMTRQLKGQRDTLLADQVTRNRCNDAIGIEQGRGDDGLAERVDDFAAAPETEGILIDGRMVREGGPELAHELEDKGYAWLEEAPPGAEAVAVAAPA